jgi:UDP-N-acetylmuramoyl-L-alanyl-D-glutamate--2,6-diaminopimelate ligase
LNNLTSILSQLPTTKIVGATDIQISGITIDSRKANKDAVFVAIKGTQTDGHNFINQVIQQGASVIVCNDLPVSVLPQITYVQVVNTMSAAGILAAAFYGNPSQQFKLVGVTGTNGKTSVATLLHQLFTALGYTCGLISTVRNLIGLDVIEATHTTPDPIALQELLAKMKTANCNYVFMEVSSHAAHQYRIAGAKFAGAIFSNITHDHLDYHGTFDEYIKAKKMFFDGLDKNAFALINIDDKRGRVMVQNTTAKVITYGLKNMVDYKAKVLENSLDGLYLDINSTPVHCRMIGQFNAYNLLSVYATACLLGVEKDEAMRILSSLTGAEGRFDPTRSAKDNLLGIIDYAHTPDALLNVLQTIKQLREGTQQIYTIVGCGGDRDNTKRPLMAKVACEYSDKVLLTSDNPRTENAEEILTQMEAGVEVYDKKKTMRIADRREAIKIACQMMKPNDILLIAGKGHEKYQDIDGVKYPFDDKQILLETFKLLER